MLFLTQLLGKEHARLINIVNHFIETESDVAKTAFYAKLVYAALINYMY